MPSTPLVAPHPSIVDIVPDSWTKPYWDAAKEHRLAAAKCGGCGQFRLPPTSFCPNCLSQATEWTTLSGRATLYSFTIVRHAVLPELADTVPYAIAVVTLPDAGDVKLLTNIVGCNDDDVRIGQDLTVVFDDIDDDVTVPRFTPV